MRSTLSRTSCPRADGTNQIEASGNVELKRQEMRLKADEVRFNRATQDVEAKGRIVVEDPEWKVKSADALRMNMTNRSRGDRKRRYLPGKRPCQRERPAL